MKMEKGMKDYGKVILNMVQVYFIGRMVVISKENGKMMILKAMEYMLMKKRRHFKKSILINNDIIYILHY